MTSIVTWIEEWVEARRLSKRSRVAWLKRCNPSPSVFEKGARLYHDSRWREITVVDVRRVWQVHGDTGTWNVVWLAGEAAPVCDCPSRLCCAHLVVVAHVLQAEELL